MIYLIFEKLTTLNPRQVCILPEKENKSLVQNFNYQKLVYRH